MGESGRAPVVAVPHRAAKRCVTDARPGLFPIEPGCVLVHFYWLPGMTDMAVLPEVTSAGRLWPLDWRGKGGDAMRAAA